MPARMPDVKSHLYSKVAVLLVVCTVFTTALHAAPKITSLSPTSGNVGTSVTISGSAFGSSQGTSTVTFNGVTATPTSWSSSKIVAAVPSAATTGNVVVTVNGSASSGVKFTVTPNISGVSPNSSAVGATVTIAGSGFGSTQGTSTIKFNGTTATPTTWSASSIVVPVPSGATTGNVVITVGGVASNSVAFTVLPAPSITTLSPNSGAAGATVTIGGNNFGSSQGTGTVSFNGVLASSTSWSASSIIAMVPSGVTSGNVVVHASGVNSNGVSFTVVPPPSISSLSPSSGAVGASVTITGNNFGTAQGTGTVSFNGITASPTSWSATSIVTPVPSGATTGNVIVYASGVNSNSVSFTVLSAPSITSVSPGTGAVGASVAVTGNNFGPTQGSSTISFNGTVATPTSWSATSIVAPVPSGATTGNVVVYAGGVNSNGVSFTVVPGPTISTISPGSGSVGASVTITGSNFGTTQGAGSVSFNGTAGAPSSWSTTQIVVPVPSGATTGNVIVNTSGVNSNGVSFTVLPVPSITSLSPTSGPVGASVTISGNNFGATQGSGTVSFNGTPATVTNWSTGSIIVGVPAGASTGNVIVYTSGVNSNGVSFTVLPTPNISSLSPTSGALGSSVTITGTNFGSTQGTSTVTFNGTSATANSWSTNSILTTVPSGATSGNVVVTVSGVSSNGATFTVLPTPNIANLSPSSGPIGTSVTVTGTSFGASQGNSTITFHGTSATPSSWSDTSITVPVPSGTSTGNVVVTVNGVPSNSASFTVTSYITSLSPSSGPVATSVTISGTSFGVSQGANTVTFNGTSAVATSWSDTSIVAPVPNGATTGNVVIVSGTASNGVNFTVTTIAPTLQSIAVTPGTASIAAGNTQAFTATGTYSDNSTQNLTPTATWISSDSTVAAVDATGTANTFGNGQVTVQANVATVSGAATLTVTPGQLDAVITPAYTPLGGFQQSSPNQKAIAVGSDGFSRFVTGDTSPNGQEVVYVHCLDQDCVTSNTATIVTGYETLAYAMALGPDGFARIVYSNPSPTNGSVGFIQCYDADCVDFTNTIVDQASDNGVSSVVVGSDGTSYIAYDYGNDEDGPQGIGMATCNGTACSTTYIAQISTRDVIGGAIAMDQNGNPVIAYVDDSESSNSSAHYYANGTDTVISNDCCGFDEIDLTVAPDGFGRVIFTNFAGNGFNFIQCTSATCTSPATTTVAPANYGDSGYASGGVGADGNPQIFATLTGIFPNQLAYFRCVTPNCSNYNEELTQGSWNNTFSSILGSDGLIRGMAQMSTTAVAFVRAIQECPTSVTLSSTIPIPFDSNDNFPQWKTGMGIVTAMQANPATNPSTGKNWNGTAIGEEFYWTTPLQDSCPSNVLTPKSHYDVFHVGCIDTSQGSLCTPGYVQSYLGTTLPVMDNIFYDFHYDFSTDSVLNAPGVTTNSCSITYTQSYYCHKNKLGTFSVTENLNKGSFNGTPVTIVTMQKQ